MAPNNCNNKSKTECYMKVTAKDLAEIRSQVAREIFKKLIFNKRHFGGVLHEWAVSDKNLKEVKAEYGIEE